MILVTNDDGVTAPGIRNLIQWMNILGEVVVVAPDSPQSGMGHAITIHDTLRCNPTTQDAGPQTEYACSGTPVDCVKLAVHQCDLQWHYVGRGRGRHAAHSFHRF